MKKPILFLLVIFLCGQSVLGAHLKGGWIQYSYLGPGAAANTSKYQITVRQYMACNSTGGQRDSEVFVGVFDGGTNQRINTLTVPLSGSEKPDKTTYSACLSTKPPVCYIIDVYTTTVDLPNLAAGYTLASQRCCRINDIVNLAPPSNDAGISYTAKIPGNISGNTYFNNSSPVFAQKDTVLVCYSAPFTLDFSASDSDADSLSYMFCSGLHGGFSSNNDPQGARPNPPSNPPYSEISYSGGFAGSSPLGPDVTIDSHTGIISGIAPGTTGDYVIAVCVNEYRNGVLISSTKKEIHVAVANCTISAAALKPTYISCNGTTLTFENESSSSAITSYAWDFGVPSLTTDTSSSPTPSYDFLQSGKDSGTFVIKLKVSSAAGCQDSTTAKVLVYPGFNTDFTVQGTCFLNTYQFKDATTTKYGVVNSWRWNFGDTTTLADTARAKDSVWKYTSARTVNATLITTNSKGCVDTMMKPVTILDRPILNLPFRDTLICSIDTLMLRVNMGNTGTVTWTPMNGPNRNRILNANTATPLVFPRDSTKYYVSINDNGCANTDSVTVNVLQFIAVTVADTGICRTDSFRLRPISDALSYQWTASTGEKVENVKNPMVKPLVTTQYNVIANLGKCQARDSAIVRSVAYPTAALGADVTICYGNRVQLHGSAVGSVFFWSPSASLVNENTLSPTAGPTKTTMYILTVTDTIGCPKPSSDTLIVTVVPMVVAYAGKDTTVLPGQPLVLEASGGISYLWRPTTGLNDPTLAEPTAILDNSIDSITYIVRVTAQGGCYAEDDVKVRVYKPGADILVPSAFTPNGDGKNDIIKPTVVGVQKLTYFSVYNRWGQLLYSTPEIGKGWDGNFAGQAQASGTYVYQALALDYLGNALYRKGTFVLIR